MSATRQDVAHAAGVSLQSVNDFFSTGRRESRGFSDEQLRRIVQGLIATGYVHRRAARRGLGRKTVLFELPRTWVHDRPTAGALRSSEVSDSMLFGSVTAALSRAAGAMGARLEIVTNMSDLTWPEGLPEGSEWTHMRRQYSAVTAVEQYRRILAERERSIAGIILIDPARGDARLRWLGDMGIPYVVMGRSPGETSDGHCVDIDDTAGFDALVRHLRGMGVASESIGHVRFTDDGTGPPTRRRAGVLQGLGWLPSSQAESASVTSSNAIEIDYFESDHEDVVASLAGWLSSNRWRAVVADCDRFASYVSKAAQRAGISIDTVPGPDRLVLAGCDDSHERHASPVPWATLRQPVHEWAKRSMLQLARQTDPSFQVGPEPVLVAPALIPGGAH